MLPTAEATLESRLENGYLANHTFSTEMAFFRDPLSKHRRLCLSQAAIASVKQDSLE